MNNELNKEIFEKMIEELSKNIPPSPFSNLFKPQPMKIEILEPELDNTRFRFMSRMWGLPIYTSNYLPTITETKVRGIPSNRKPNTRRPLYRKITIKKTNAYAIKGMGIISPPGYFAGMI